MKTGFSLVYLVHVSIRTGRVWKWGTGTQNKPKAKSNTWYNKSFVFHNFEFQSLVIIYIIQWNIS